MSVEAEIQTGDVPASRVRWLTQGLAKRSRRFLRSVTSRFSSSLTRRILVLNLGGLAALFVAFLYVNQFRSGLIDARVQSLQTQGEIIAAAIAASATVETDTITLDPEQLLQLAPGQSYRAGEEGSATEFSIDPSKIGPVLRRLVSPTRTRARVYDRDGDLLLDSRLLSMRGNVVRDDLPAPVEEPTIFERTWNAVKRRFSSVDLPLYVDVDGTNGKSYPEVTLALSGTSQPFVRVNAKGQTIVSVAVPIQRARNLPVRGALLLSTEGGDIDAIIASDRWSIIRIFLISAGVMFLLSLFLAGTIAGPVRRLAEAAERVRRGIKSRQEIPDFTGRSDEIGHLSGALRDMTKALYGRMDAIESFAADVAHELKNPLTSLRSATEILPRMKTDAQRERLFAIIQHDVRRLDRLISDISDASRLDAELARADMEPVNLRALLEAVVSVVNGLNLQDNVRVILHVAPAEATGEGARAGFFVLGHDSRLGQVVNNLLDNARSFSPPGGTVRLTLRRNRTERGEEAVDIVVDDDGPGIPPHALERIFERFYTDRPNHGFGQNSGLGLSISRQIIEAHRGQIRATNRVDDDRVLGARFVIRLPTLK
ncbi:MAG: sensor histidine kinase [Methylobacteriaceae bacterium]|nr:sensor histidine kinase [Methylobacteriaceae bacterium]